MDCYSYGFKRGDEVEEISDKDRVNYISKKTSTSSSLVKKLGKGFVAVKNSYPKVKTVHNHTVNVVLKGSKAKLAWKSVKDAKEYKIFIKGSDGKYKEVAKSTKTTAEIKNIKKGKSYSMMIMAYFSNGKYEEVDNGVFTFKA